MPSYCNLVKCLQRTSIETSKSSSNSRLFRSCSITSAVTANGTCTLSGGLMFKHYSEIIIMYDLKLRCLLRNSVLV